MNSVHQVVVGDIVWLHHKLLDVEVCSIIMGFKNRSVGYSGRLASNARLTVIHLNM
jgi:hypothetical protein